METSKHLSTDKPRDGSSDHSVGLIIRQKEPANLETPLDQVDSYLTLPELLG
jgi:hypothetical protein